MRTFLLVFLFSVTGITNAAAQDTLRPCLPFAVYIMPLQLIPVAYSWGPGLGAEFWIYHHFSLTIDGSAFYKAGYMARMNIKYYLPNIKLGGKKGIASYVALEYAYKKQAYSVQDNLYDGNYSLSDSEVNYSVYKFVNIVNFKFGYVTKWFKPGWLRKFYTDGYVGLGIRYKVVHNTLSPGQIRDLYHWNEGDIDNSSNSDWVGLAPSLSLGIKIGYRYR